MPAPATTPAPIRRLRGRALANLLRMGHCAPTVMKTLLDELGLDSAWLVRLVAGLPGGIGNSRNECGGITAPMVLLGLRHARDPAIAGLPVVVHRGHVLLQSFRERHGSTSCRDILGDARLPLPCVGVVRVAPERCLAVDSDGGSTVAGERLEAYVRLHGHLVRNGFHCAHEVLQHAPAALTGERNLAAATEAFVGGTAFAGMTCSALAAGVMLIGLAFGEVENSRPRVLRMVATMAVGGNAFSNDLNAFNRAMNLGHELARWFEGAFGSTQCREVTGCDFATLAEVERYVEGGTLRRCRDICRAVAARVDAIAARERLQAPAASAWPPGGGVGRSAPSSVTLDPGRAEGRRS